MRIPIPAKVGLWLKFPIAMEGLWLVAIMAVPVVIAPQDSMVFHYQLPKIVLLRGLVSLMAALWLLRWLSSQVLPTADLAAPTNVGWRGLRQWIAAQPVRLLSVGVVVFLSLNLVSATFSVSTGVSFWGGFKAPDGFGLHNVLTFAVLFWVVSRNITTSAQLWRILAAVAASGGIAASVAVLQRLGAISAGAPATGLEGITSTLGSPDLLGSYLVLTIPITIGLATTRFVRRFAFGEQALWVTLISLQMLAVAFTLSPVAAIGLVVALIVLAGLGHFVMEQAATIKVVAITAVALSLTFLGMSFIPDLPELVEAETSNQLFNEAEFLGDLPVPAEGFLSQRQGIWATSADLILTRPSLPSQGGMLPGLRLLLGYGPDTYAYVFPLAATGDVGLQNNAQNEFLHRTVELGFLGGLSSLALYIVAIAVVVWLMFRLREDITQDHRMVLVMITAGLAARLSQQMLHLGGVGDTMLFWVMLALIPAAFRAWPVSTESRSFDFSNIPVGVERPAYLLGARIAMVLLLFAAMGWIFADRGINIVRADNIAANAQLIDATEQSRAEGLALFDEAIELAPDVPNYYRMRGDFLVAVNKTVPPGLESNEDLEEIYTDRVMALRTDPLAGESLLDMANSAFDLTRAGYEGLDAEAVEQYRELMALSPNFPESHALLWTLLAVAYMDAGRMERSLDFLESAVAVDASTFTHSKALFVQGAAYSELGQFDNAIDSLNQVLDLRADEQMTTQTYRLLANVYSDAGKPQLASDHYEQYQLRHNPDGN